MYCASGESDFEIEISRRSEIKLVNEIEFFSLGRPLSCEWCTFLFLFLFFRGDPHCRIQKGWNPCSKRGGSFENASFWITVNYLTVSLWWRMNIVVDINWDVLCEWGGKIDKRSWIILQSRINNIVRACMECNRKIFTFHGMRKETRGCCILYNQNG